jgi:hypothetical protein
MGKNNGLLLFLEILVLVMMFFYAVSEIGECGESVGLDSTPCACCVAGVSKQAVACCSLFAECLFALRTRPFLFALSFRRCVAS